MKRVLPPCLLLLLSTPPSMAQIPTSKMRTYDWSRGVATAKREVKDFRFLYENGTLASDTVIQYFVSGREDRLVMYAWIDHIGEDGRVFVKTDEGKLVPLTDDEMLSAGLSKECPEIYEGKRP